MIIEEQCCKELSKILKVSPPNPTSSQMPKFQGKNKELLQNKSKMPKSKPFTTKRHHKFILAPLVFRTLKGQS